jgi:hypothetical protein
MLHAACVCVNAVIARTAGLVSGTFLGSELISLLQDHLMKLVPVVEIV